MSHSHTLNSRVFSRGRCRGLLAVFAVLFCVSNLQALILPPPILPPIDPPIIDWPTVINFDSRSVGTIVTRQYESIGVIFEGNSITAPRIELDDPVVGYSTPNVLSVPHGEPPKREIF